MTKKNHNSKKAAKATSTKYASQQTVIGSQGDKYTVSFTKDGKGECSCDRWTNTSPRKDCKHIIAAKAGNKSVGEKEKEMAKKIADGKLEPKNIKLAMVSIVKLVKKQPKKLSKSTVYKQLAKQFAQPVMRKAIETLWHKENVLRKDNGRYIIVEAN